TKRTAVAIDRVLGSVAQGPFDFEALTSGDLKTVIILRNFELWQLGLLGLALRDLCLGRVRIGYAKSRGFGNVSAGIDKREVGSLLDDGFAATADGFTVKGISALADDKERRDYGMEDPRDSSASVVSTAKPIDDLVGKALILERSVDSAGWCAPEA